MHSLDFSERFLFRLLLKLRIIPVFGQHFFEYIRYFSQVLAHENQFLSIHRRTINSFNSPSSAHCCGCCSSAWPTNNEQVQNHQRLHRWNNTWSRWNSSDFLVCVFSKQKMQQTISHSLSRSIPLSLFHLKNVQNYGEGANDAEKAVVRVNSHQRSYSYTIELGSNSPTSFVCCPRTFTFWTQRTRERSRIERQH